MPELIAVAAAPVADKWGDAPAHIGVNLADEFVVPNGKVLPQSTGLPWGLVELRRYCRRGQTRSGIVSILIVNQTQKRASLACTQEVQGTLPGNGLIII